MTTTRRYNDDGTPRVVAQRPTYTPPKTPPVTQEAHRSLVGMVLDMLPVRGKANPDIVLDAVKVKAVHHD